MYLPRPYPDELVGSLLHRAERQLGIGREQLLMRLTQHPLSSHSFLITPYAGVAHAFGLPLERFLLQHTVLPYMTAFMQPGERSRAISALLEVNGGGGRTASLVRRSVTGQMWLRFCRRCVAEELRSFGETYWHRAHQLTGVEVCVKHDCDLYVTPIRISRGSGIPPPHEVIDYQTTNPSVSRTIAEAVAHASAQALWTSCDEECSPEAYQDRVKGLGYVYLGGKAHGALLSHDLGTYFGKCYLARYDCIVGAGRKGLWPAKLLQASAHRATTFKHILLQVFLDSGPTPSSTRIEFEGRTRPRQRDWQQIERSAIACMEAEVNRHKAMGTRIGLGDLYRLAHVCAIVRVQRHQVPQLIAWLEDFKNSPQSARIPGRRPRTCKKKPT